MVSHSLGIAGARCGEVSAEQPLQHTVSIAEEALERYETFSDHYQPSIDIAV